MTNHKRPFNFIFYPKSVQRVFDQHDYLLKENKELNRIVSQPINSHLKLYTHYKLMAAKNREEVEELKRHQFIIKKDNHELTQRITELTERNLELKKRHYAYKNSIEHLLKLLDEKDKQLTQKDAFIEQLIEESVIGANRNRYFDFQ